MRTLELVGLTDLMARTAGAAGKLVGLIDGPIAVQHELLRQAQIRPLQKGGGGAEARGAASLHGTFVAGILCARRGAAAPAICPACTLIVRPIFSDGPAADGGPSATVEELAAALVETADAGARIINLSAAVAPGGARAARTLELALAHVGGRGAIVVAAAGNEGTVGSSALTRSACVIPVTACDARGRVLPSSNLSRSAGSQGLCAPGEAIVSLTPEGGLRALSGTSFAAPFVTGALALLWSLFPNVSVAQLRHAVLSSCAGPRTTIVPPRLDARAACQQLARAHGGRAPQPTPEKGMP